VKRLSLSLDQVGLLRESRKLKIPDPVIAASAAELAGVDSISIHLRLDRRGIRERDLYILKETVKTKLNLHIAPKAEMFSLIQEVKPHEVTLLPERPGELYTERGLTSENDDEFDKDLFSQIQGVGSRLYILIEPEVSEIKAAVKTGCDGVELYSGPYTSVTNPADRETEMDRIIKAAELAQKSGLEVHVGGSLNYQNIFPLLSIQPVQEFVIGHAIVAQALMVGFTKAVEDMITLIKWS